jgi:hypothetical protein
MAAAEELEADKMINKNWTGRFCVLTKSGKSNRHTFSFVLFLALVCCVTISMSRPAKAAEVDSFMGDWQGNWTMAEGTGTGSGPLVAQVIALGNGKYRLNLLREFDSRAEPIAVIEGRLEDTEVRFAGRIQREGTDSNIQAAIKNGKLAGTIKGRNSEGQYVSVDFALDKTVRLSPTLGAKPPANAIVLFDGTNFDEWEPIAPVSKGLVSLIDILGPAENSVAYLRSMLWSDQQQKAHLEIGSDDGVKVWLNSQVVHANNTMRGLRAGDDKVDVTLKKGWNELLLKVTQGSGGWEACVRLAGPNGEMPNNVNEMISVESSDTGTNKYLLKNDGFLSIWEIAGPYREEGKSGRALFDVAFAPEKPDTEIESKRINISNSDTKGVRWKLVDDAMEVRPGAGSIVTKKKFKDFKLHLEFRTPFMPESRGQGRGNSGVYLQERYEVQILDSYGLQGRDNECGGIYKVGAPRVNMCAPPMQWQSYDITFHAPRFDAIGNKVEDARLTVVHNGVMIHENLAVPKPTEASPNSNITEPGGIYLQDHGNLVQYRNIWLVELPQDSVN